MCTAFDYASFDDETDYIDPFATDEIEPDFFYSIDLETERMFLGYPADETPQQRDYRQLVAG